jgi:hypothetical protein
MGDWTMHGMHAKYFGKESCKEEIPMLMRNFTAQKPAFRLVTLVDELSFGMYELVQWNDEVICLSYGLVQWNDEFSLLGFWLAQ